MTDTPTRWSTTRLDIASRWATPPPPATSTALVRIVPFSVATPETRPADVSSPRAAQAERGELLDGEEVFEELREMIEERRRAKAPNR
jgi:hypothetical protein